MSPDVTNETDQPAPAARPLLRVVRGEPTPEELAALVAVLAARGGTESAPKPVRSGWARPGHAVRAPLSARGSGWRESGFGQGVRTRADW